MSLHTFELEVDELGRGRIVMDGEDISTKVRGVSIVARVGDVAIVGLEVLASTITFKGPGQAYVELSGQTYELVPVAAADTGSDEPERCAEHHCPHPEDRRRGRMGGAPDLCGACGCEVKEG